MPQKRLDAKIGSCELTVRLRSFRTIIFFGISRAYAGINLTGYPPGTPGLLHRNVCSAPGLLHNRRCPGAGPINDDVPGAGHLYQLAFKHENHQHSYLGLKIKMPECPIGPGKSPEDSERHIKLLICSRPIN